MFEINPKENFFVAERKRRLGSLMSMLANAKAEGREISVIKLSAELGIGWGITKNKTREYLKLLEDTGRIKITGDVVEWV